MKYTDDDLETALEELAILDARNALEELAKKDAHALESVLVRVMKFIPVTPPFHTPRVSDISFSSAPSVKSPSTVSAPTPPLSPVISITLPDAVRSIPFPIVYTVVDVPEEESLSPLCLACR